MKRNHLIHLLLLSLVCLCTNQSSGMTLVKDKQPVSVIFVPEDSSATAKFAASELQAFVLQSTGAKLPIVSEKPGNKEIVVICVGAIAVDQMGIKGGQALSPEQYTIRSHGKNTLVLFGNDTKPPTCSPEQSGTVATMIGPDSSPFQELTGRIRATSSGTLLSVHHFLEKFLGIRWYMPGKLGTVVPHHEDLSIPDDLDITDGPAMPIRQHALVRFNWGDGASGKPQKVTADSELGRWYLRVGYGRSMATWNNHSFQLLTGHLRKQGKAESAMISLLPDGRRDSNITSYGHGNLCLSNPETLSDFVRMVQGIFDKSPMLGEFSVAPADVWIPCACADCLKRLPEVIRNEISALPTLEQGRGTTKVNLPAELRKKFRAASSKLLAKFHVDVAKELFKTHPDRLVSTLCYEGYGTPADYAEIKDIPRNLSVCITKSRHDFWDHKYRDEVFKTVNDWQKLTPNIFVWEYYIWHWRPWGKRPKLEGYPVFFPSLIDQDIKFMMANGMKGESCESQGMVHLQPGLDHLTSYVTAKLLMNPQIDVRALLDEYYSLFYGQASGEMKEFWGLAENCWLRDTKDMDPRNDTAEIMDVLYPKEDLQKMFELLSHAKSKVAPESFEHQRITLIEKEIEPSRKRLLTQDQAPVFHSSAVFPAPVIDNAFKEGWGESIKLVSADKAEAEVKIAHDPQKLYFSFRIKEGRSVKLPSELDGNGWYWEDKNGFIVPRGASNSLMITFKLATNDTAVILVNASGKSLSARNGEHTGPWDSRLEAAVKMDQQHWQGTLSLPWESIGKKLGPGMETKVNLIWFRAGQKPQAWYPSDNISPPKRFGMLYSPEN